MARDTKKEDKTSAPPSMGRNDLLDQAHMGNLITATLRPVLWKDSILLELFAWGNLIAQDFMSYRPPFLATQFPATTHKATNYLTMVSSFWLSQLVREMSIDVLQSQEVNTKKLLPQITLGFTSALVTDKILEQVLKRFHTNISYRLDQSASFAVRYGTVAIVKATPYAHSTYNFMRTAAYAVKNHRVTRVSYRQVGYRFIVENSAAILATTKKLTTGTAQYLATNTAQWTRSTYTSATTRLLAYRATCSPKLYYTLGKTYAAQGKLDLAEQAFLKMPATLKMDHLKFYELGNLYLEQKQIDKAEQAYDQVPRPTLPRIQLAGMEYPSLGLPQLMAHYTEIKKANIKLSPEVECYIESEFKKEHIIFIETKAEATTALTSDTQNVMQVQNDLCLFVCMAKSSETRAEASQLLDQLYRAEKQKAIPRVSAFDHKVDEKAEKPPLNKEYQDKAKALKADAVKILTSKAKADDKQPQAAPKLSTELKNQAEELLQSAYAYYDLASRGSDTPAHQIELLQDISDVTDFFAQINPVIAQSQENPVAKLLTLLNTLGLPLNDDVIGALPRKKTEIKNSLDIHYRSLFHMGDILVSLANLQTNKELRLFLLHRAQNHFNDVAKAPNFIKVSATDERSTALCANAKAAIATTDVKIKALIDKLDNANAYSALALSVMK